MKKVRLRSAMALEFLFTMRLRPESPSVTYSIPSSSSSKAGGGGGGVSAVSASSSSLDKTLAKSLSLKTSHATVAGLRR
jgi:hypothetical protein